MSDLYFYITISIFSSLEYLGYEFLGLEYLVRMMPPLSVMNVIYLSMNLSIYLSIYLSISLYLPLYNSTCIDIIYYILLDIIRYIYIYYKSLCSLKIR